MADGTRNRLTLLNWRNWNSHQKLLISLTAALAMGVYADRHWPRAVVIVATWNGFAIMLMALSWVQIATANQERMLAEAKAQDFGSILMFFAVVITSLMSLFAVGYLLGTGRPDDHPMLLAHTLLALLTVACSWLLIHTVFALHYAHLYHGGSGRTRAGVIFPETRSPDYFDFVYLSFNIGTGFQSGDIQVTSRAIRKLVLLHGLIAFAFNTSIIALMVSVVSALVTP